MISSMQLINQQEKEEKKEPQHDSSDSEGDRDDIDEYYSVDENALLPSDKVSMTVLKTEGIMGRIWNSVPRSDMPKLKNAISLMFSQDKIELKKLMVDTIKAKRDKLR